MTGSSYSRGSVSKRKLDDAISSLDDIFKSPTSSSSSSSSLSLSNLKKRKSGGGNSTNQFPSTSSTPALESLLFHPHPPHSPSHPAAPSSYVPLSLPALLARIATYSLSTYSPKPSSLSPLSASLQGWTNAGPPRERIACVTCSASILVLPPTSNNGGWDGVVGKKMEDAYCSALKEKHEPNCPWRMRASLRALYTVGKGASRSQIVQEVRDAVERLHRFEGRLTLKYPEAVIGEEEVEKLRKAVGVNEKNAILLALFGWDLSGGGGGGGDDVLHCQYCSRDVWLASYLDSSIDPSSSKPFDVVTQHAPFCAFVTPPSPSALVGWESRMEGLLQSRGRKRTESFEKDGKMNTSDVVGYVRGVLGPVKKSTSNASMRSL